MTLLLRLWRWLASLFGRAKPADTVNLYRAEVCEEEPELLDRRRVYLVGGADAPWSASLICPCGCQEIVRLSLLPGDRPRWRALVSARGVVTLDPSIWRVRGCRSHFFIRHGRVLWAAPDSRLPVMPVPPIRPKADRHVQRERELPPFGRPRGGQT